jgi:hypothetical protein
MTEGACTDEKDVPMMVVEDDPITCCSWISLRGPVKIELDEILWGRRSKGGATRRGGKRRGGENLKRRKRSPMPKDREFGGSVGQVCVGPLLKLESFHDVAMALMPTLLPREGDTSEKSSIPFFPSFPKDKSWKKLPNTIKKGGMESLVPPVRNGFEDAVSVVV